MRSASRCRPRLMHLEDRSVPANILQVEPIWISPPHVREFKPDGTLVGQITPPGGDPRDVVVSPNGDVQVFDGTFSPQLRTYHPATDTWTSRTTAGWSTVNNLSYGGIAAYGDYVYVTDMETAYETPPFNGIIRFNMADGSVDRFAEGSNYIAMCLGLDGYIYAMGGSNIDRYDRTTMSYLDTFNAPLGDARGVAVAANGDYYVSDYGNTVNHYDSAGNLIRSQHAGNGAVDISTDGQVISGNLLMDLDLNILGTVGDGNYHASFATYQKPVVTPVLSHVESSTLSYVEGDPATVVSTAITVNDSHSPTIASARVALKNNFAPGQDVLGFVDANGINGAYNPKTGVLTLTGVASAADYQAALRTVTYQNTSQNPSTANRTVTFRVDNGLASDNLSNVVSRTISVSAVNTAPAITIPAPQLTAPQGAASVLTGIRVGDVDAGSGRETLRLSVTTGTIRFASLTGVTVVAGANISPTITLAGTIAQLNYALRNGNLLYRPPVGYTGTVTLGLDLDDRGNRGSGGPLTDHEVIAITIEHMPPVLTGMETVPLGYRERQGNKQVTATLRAIVPQGIITGASVAITDNFASAEDALYVAPRLGITSTYDPATGVLTLSGAAPILRYQNALRGVRYANTSHNPSTLPRVITFQIDDGTAADNLSNVVSRTINVKPVNDAPTLSLPATRPTGSQNSDIAVDGISVFDVDSNGGIERLTLRGTRGTIRFVNLAGLTVVGGANDSSLLVVEGTIAQLNDALVSGNLVFHPEVDFRGTAFLDATLNDVANTGLGGARAAHRVIGIDVI
jgi:hypothetical protein